MRTMPISLRSKILPIVTATALGAGALTAGATNQQNSRVNETGSQKNVLVRTTEKLNNSLDSLNFERAEKTIDFNDYYMKSKDIINKAELDKDAVYLEARENDSAVFKEMRKSDLMKIKALLGTLIALTAVLGWTAVFLYMNYDDPSEVSARHYADADDALKLRKATTIGAGVCALLTALTLLIQNGSTKKHYIDDYVNFVQGRFDSYKRSKMNDLDASKEKYLKEAEKSENTALLDDIEFQESNENLKNAEIYDSSDDYECAEVIDSTEVFIE